MAIRKPKENTRLRHSESEARSNREEEDRGTLSEERVLSDNERLDEFRKTTFQSVLPDIPTIKGYHVCWLTTANPRDSIQGRTRLGYEPIKASDIPGWELASLKSGDFAGCIGINEMVAFKLPMHLYEAYMKEAHHNQPLDEEQKLSEARRLAEEEASGISRKPVSFELETGSAELGDHAPEPPSFAETLGERTVT